MVRADWSSMKLQTTLASYSCASLANNRATVALVQCPLWAKSGHAVLSLDYVVSRQPLVVSAGL